MRDFINDFKLAWKVARGATVIRNENIEDMKKHPFSFEAKTHYRQLWPKTPCFCCDDAHEAGWIQGFIYLKHLTKGDTDGIKKISNGRVEESVSRLI